MDDGWTMSDPPTMFVEFAIKVALEMAAEATTAERDRCAEVCAKSVALCAAWVERNTEHSTIAGFAHAAIRVVAADALTAISGEDRS